jgi:sialic acid synthase SpsE/D-lyxose ketol-isomerase
MFYIFEMANNHQGSVSHAKTIIDEFSYLAKEKKINAGIKFQFRQLDTFIHKDFKNSDLKFVKRFNSTRLEKEQFFEIINYARQTNLKIVATPFDNDSIPWLEDLGVDIIKVASCSSDDWPLLKQLAKINKKIIISTGGVELSHLEKVHDLFAKNGRDFAFMHCVGEYPTDASVADMSRIYRLQEKFPNIEIGFSTHESPLNKSLAPIAVTMGCTLIEKHVGVATNDISLNGYSNTPDQMKKQIEEIQYVERSMHGKSSTQKETLKSLKRGVYLKTSKFAGEQINYDDVYFALPAQQNQADASMVDNEWGWVKRKDNVIGKVLLKDIKADEPLILSFIKESPAKNEILNSIRSLTTSLLRKSGVTITKKDNVEISCHYGLKSFFHTGAVIVDKINRQFCKKIIVMSQNQSHPEHYHLKKEEAFELIYGDCTINLNGKDIQLKKGEPFLIPRKAKHSFNTLGGCVIEEVSTTHHRGDSVYSDPTINSLKLQDRKIKINLLGAKNEFK